jgi:DEAD/DEAH box helicase
LFSSLVAQQILIMVRSKKKSAPISLYNTKKYRSMAQRRMTSSDRPDTDLSSVNGPLPMLGQSVTDDTEEHGTSQPSPLLSDELMNEFGCQDMILTTKSKRDARSEQKRKLDQVELTAQEVRLAQQQTKQQKRKLHQIQQRQQQKQLRQTLYTSLQQYAIGKPNATEPSNGAQLLLHKSSQLGKKVYTKKERLQRALQKERLGVALTEQESGLLYSTVSTPVTEHQPIFRERCEHKNCLSNNDTNLLQEVDAVALHSTSSMTNDDKTVQSELSDTGTPSPLHSPKDDEALTIVHDKEKKPGPSSTSSLAAQMMASIFSLHQKKPQSATLRNESTSEPENSKIDDIHDSTSSALSTAEKPADTVSRKAPYIAPPPLVLQTTPSYASTKIAPSSPLINRNCICEVSNRPLDVVQLRQELPVVMMEFEIMDTVRNHDVVIVCSETGSGKSTQIPQFLYEAGFGRTKDNKLIIGITQPRRVAAVSSAKRVCYEMGFGNGQSISRNNVVSYQTRYETAGLGTNTAIQFMTDGILLQEVQSDLLLRKYSVIILDEAHERNLNTDILIGLLSVAIPLRKQASLESPSLPPLKVIIMSATLRTEDFTKNPRLFSSHPPAVIQVPGRTYPVTVHHSKITELENYGKTNTFDLDVFIVE